MFPSNIMAIFIFPVCKLGIKSQIQLCFDHFLVSTGFRGVLSVHLTVSCLCSAPKKAASTLLMFILTLHICCVVGEDVASFACVLAHCIISEAVVNSPVMEMFWSSVTGLHLSANINCPYFREDVE